MHGVMSIGAVCVAMGVAAAGPVTMESLLAEMVDRGALTRLPEPAYVCVQASSYDRRTKEPADKDGWFANEDYGKFIREEENGGRKEWVMMEADGPGAIVRMWSANPKGTLRVYVDGDVTPVVEEKLERVLGGKWIAPTALSYEASKGWSSYVPLPYAKKCKVTCDASGFYYQVNYRTYAAGTAVESISAAVLGKAKSALEQCAATLNTLEWDNSDSTIARKTDEREGEIVMELPRGAHAVTGFYMMLPQEGEIEQATRSLVIEGEFDGEKTIWCPIGDFFGSGVGVNAYQDRVRRVEADRTMACRWVMPYEKTAVLRVRDVGKTGAKIKVMAFVKPWTWDDRSMHFHAAWHQEYPVHALGAKGTMDWNYVDVQGKGVYVGDVLSVMNPVKDWWGEGDEKIYVDGETFPSHIGTGTEDYYGYAWCWPEKFVRAFHAQTRVDGQQERSNWGRTTLTRVRSLDAIPFTTSLSMNIEVWHWKACDMEYATTAYYYARPGSTSNRGADEAAAGRALVQAPVPPPPPPPKKIAGAIECEEMKVIGKSEGVVAEPQGGFGPGLWSGEKQIWVRGKKIGDYVDLEVPVGKEAGDSYRVIVHATKSWDYAMVRFRIDGSKAGVFDLYSGGHEVKLADEIDLGVVQGRTGAITLRCEIVGANAKAEAPKTYFGLDCVELRPVK